MSIEILKELRLGKIDNYFHNKGLKEHVQCIKICDVELPSGEIVVGDPVSMDGYEVLNKKVKPGKYPVYLYLHHINQEKWVAFAEIRFLEQVPFVFKPAHTKSNKKIKLKKDEEVGYPTYNQLMSFMDRTIAFSLMSFNEKEKSSIWENWEKSLKENQNGSYTLLNSSFGAGNVVAFSSGYKNGVYGAYWGMDMFNKICSLIVDFRTLLTTKDIQISIDWGRAYDRGSTHNNKKKEKNLNVEDLAGYNHIAAFLRWMLEHKLVSDSVLSLYPELEMTKEDLRVIIDKHPIFNGSLKRMHFNEKGRAFADDFYLFRMHSEEGYPRCTDIHAENYFGLEKYNSEEFQDEAYLFVPYDEAYYEGISKFIDQAWERFIQEYED